MSKDIIMPKQDWQNKNDLGMYSIDCTSEQKLLWYFFIQEDSKHPVEAVNNKMICLNIIWDNIIIIACFV